MSKQPAASMRATNLVITMNVFDIPPQPGIVPGTKAFDFGFVCDILVNEDPNHPLSSKYPEAHFGCDPGKSPEETARRIIQQRVDAWQPVLAFAVADPVDSTRVTRDGSIPSKLYTSQNAVDDVMPTPAPEQPDQATLDEQAAKQAAQQSIGAAIQTIKAVNAGIAQGILKSDDADLVTAKQTITDVLATNPDLKIMLASIG